MTEQRKKYFMIIAAFAAVYLIWGSTYLAIRFVVATMPPFFTAGMRFLIAGAILYAYSIKTSTCRPEAVHWRSAAVVGFLMLLVAHGLVMWAEQYVNSGMTALLVSTVPLWVTLLNWKIFKGDRPGIRSLLGIAGGITGMIILFSETGMQFAKSRLEIMGMVALAISSLSWALGSLCAGKAKLPSFSILATAMEMLCGGAMLTVTGILNGEIFRYSVSNITILSMVSFAYLTVFGSLIAFTAFIWLLQAVDPAKVSTYAFVNPVVAVYLGWLLADEALTARTILAAAVIIGSVVVITIKKQKKGGGS